MSPNQMDMMMADMQTMVDILPPGIFLQMRGLKPQPGRSDMMNLHQQMHAGDLLQQPPRQVLRIVCALAR